MQNNMFYGYQPQQNARFFSRSNFQQQQQWSGLKGRPVSSVEEVRGTIVESDGSLFIFPDLGHKRIYTKQINYNGESIINCYSIDTNFNNQDTLQNINIQDYVKVDEINKIVSELSSEINNLKQKIDDMNKPLDQQNKTSKNKEAIF